MWVWCVRRTSLTTIIESHAVEKAWCITKARSTHRSLNVLGKRGRAGVQQVPDRSSPVSTKWIQKQQDLGWWGKQIRQFGERCVLSNTARDWLNLCGPLSQSASQDIVSNCPWVSAPQHWIFRPIRPTKATHPDHLLPLLACWPFASRTLDRRFEMCLKELTFIRHLKGFERRKSVSSAYATVFQGQMIACPHNLEINEKDRSGFYP